MLDVTRNAAFAVVAVAVANNFLLVVATNVDDETRVVDNLATVLVVATNVDDETRVVDN